MKERWEEGNNHYYGIKFELFNLGIYFLLLLFIWYIYVFQIMRIGDEWKHHTINWSEIVRLGCMVRTLSMVFISWNGVSAFKHWSNLKILALGILHWSLGSPNFWCAWRNRFKNSIKFYSTLKISKPKRRYKKKLILLRLW